MGCGSVTLRPTAEWLRLLKGCKDYVNGFMPPLLAGQQCSTFLSLVPSLNERRLYTIGELALTIYVFLMTRVAVNKTYKIIWNRCFQRFIVVSEIARSGSSGSSTSQQAGKQAKKLCGQSATAFTALAAGLALAFSTVAPVWAQTGAVRGGSVAEINPNPGDPAWVPGTDVENTAYGNALKINGEAGHLPITGDAFSVKPSGPDDDRGTDADPYAAIWLSGSIDKDANQVRVTNVTLDVNGDNLHGIYAEESSWIASFESNISAEGEGASGITTQGVLHLTGNEIQAKGKDAKGVHATGNGNISAQNGNTIIATGEGVSGIYTENGNLLAFELDISAEGDYARGVVLESTDSYLVSNRTSLKNLAVEVNTMGVNDHDSGIGIAATGLSGLVLTDSTIRVGTNNSESSIGLELDRGIGSGQGAAALKNTDLIVNGESSRGIDSRGFNLTLADNVTVSLNGSESTGIVLTGSTAQIGDTTINMTGRGSIGMQLGAGTVATITDSAVTMVGQNQTGIYAFHEGTQASLARSEIDVSGGSGGKGVHVSLLGRLHLEEGSITVASQNGQGLFAQDGMIIADRTAITVKNPSVGGSATGANASGEGTVIAMLDTVVDVEAIGASAGATGLSASDKAAIEDANSQINIVGGFSAIGLGVWDESYAALIGTRLNVEAKNVTGVVANTSELVMVDVNARVTGGDTHAYGVQSSSSDVGMKNTHIVAKGTSSVSGWDSEYDTSARLDGVYLDAATTSANGGASAYAARIQGTKDILITGNSVLKAHAQVSGAEGLSLDRGATATVTDTHIHATSVSGDAFGIVLEEESAATVKDTSIEVLASSGFARGVDLSDGSTVVLLGTQGNSDARIIANAADKAIGIWADDEAEFSVTAYQIEAHGARSSSGVYALRDTKGQMSNSDIKVSGADESAGLNVGPGSELLVGGTKVTSISATGTALGAAVEGGRLDISNSDIGATGDKAAALSIVTLAGLDDSIINVSDQTTLTSSGRGLNALTYGDSVTKATFTDTRFVTNAETLASQWEGKGTQIFNLGAGTVATDNNGVLLLVERASSLNPTGRVELNLSDGAVVSGDILDDTNDLTLLTADGGTHLAVDNVNYTGTVQNVRSLSATNLAQIGGGSAVTPNTVLEDVLAETARIAGNWQIGGTLTAINGARMAPGNSIGAFSANAINWGPGTVYEVEVNAAGESDRIDITGSAPADISQTALEVSQENGNGGYRLAHDYRILTAAGGVEGEFAQVSWVDNGLINVNPEYRANEVLLSLSVDQNALDTATFTSNQRATAEGALSVEGVNAAADAAFLSSNPAASFDMLSGEIHPSTRAGLMSSSTLMSSAIMGRLRDRIDADSGAATTDKAASGYPLWVSYAHNQQTAKGNSNTARRKHRTDGLSLGGEAEVGADWKVGGAFNYTNSSIKLNKRRSSSDVDSYGLALYAGNSWQGESGALNLVAGLGHMWHDIRTKRNVDLGGAQTLKASYDARTIQVFGEIGYTMPVGESSQIEPYLGLTWLQHRSDSFQESGGPAGLKGDRGRDDVTFSTLGVRGTMHLEAPKTAYSLHAGLGWRHAFGDREPGAKLAFTEGAGQSYTVTGAPIARNTAVFSLGAEAHVGRHTSIGLGYEGQAGSRFTDHSGNIYLKKRF